MRNTIIIIGLAILTTILIISTCISRDVLVEIAATISLSLCLGVLYTTDSNDSNDNNDNKK